MSQKFKFFQLTIVLFAVLAISACGDDSSDSTTQPVTTPLNIVNPSFETSDPITSGFGGGFILSVSNWNATQPAGTFSPSTPSNPQQFQVFLEDAPNGVNTAFTNGNGNISQELTDLLTENTTYKLEVEVGERVILKLPDSYSLELRAGGVVLASGTVTPVSGRFATITVEYKTKAGDPFGAALEVHLVTNHSSSANDQAQANWDNVRGTATK